MVQRAVVVAASCSQNPSGEVLAVVMTDSRTSGSLRTTKLGKLVSMCVGQARRVVDQALSASQGWVMLE